MKLLSLNSCHVPADLNSVTSYDPTSEVNPESVGMTVKQRDAIWRATELVILPFLTEVKSRGLGY